MVLKTALAALALALAAVSPVLYERFQTLSLFYKNAPERFASINGIGPYEVKFADRVRSCEDALVIESEGVAILGCDPGRERWNTVMGFFVPGPVPNAELYVYDYQDANTPDAESLRRLELLDFDHVGADFHTLGMAYDGSSSTLFVTNHRHHDAPAIEVFKLDPASATAKHVRSVQHPLLHGPNAIAVAGEHELYVTNDHHFLVAESRALAQVETYLGLPLGTVVHVDMSPSLTDATTRTPVQANVVARVPFANGIDLLNETTLVVAATSRAAVYFYSITKNDDEDAAAAASPPPTLTYVSQIRLPYMVDNLSVASDGVLLMAGHPHVPSLGKFAQTRWVCNSPEELARAGAPMREYCGTARTLSWVSEWTEAGGLRHLYAGSEYPTSCTAARDVGRDVGIITGLYANGILVWRG